MEDDGAVLLYDGSCGFCQANVQFVLRHERTHSLRFAALQGEFGSAVMARHAELAGVDSIVWVEAAGTASETVSVKADAAHLALKYIGGWWRLLTVLWISPRSLRNWCYDFVARHRHQIPLGSDHCEIPHDDTRQRFLD